MNNMFGGCSSLNSLNLSNFTTENVEDMEDIFKNLNKNCYIKTEDQVLLLQINNI